MYWAPAISSTVRKDFHGNYLSIYSSGKTHLNAWKICFNLFSKTRIICFRPVKIFEMAAQNIASICQWWSWLWVQFCGWSVRTRGGETEMWQLKHNLKCNLLFARCCSWVQTKPFCRLLSNHGVFNKDYLFVADISSALRPAAFALDSVTLSIINWIKYIWRKSNRQKVIISIVCLTFRLG